MVSTIRLRVTAPCPYWAAVDTTAQLGCGISRVRPVIPPAGIRGLLLSHCRTGTVPELVRGEAGCRRSPRLSTLRPRKPQSGEDSRQIKFLHGVRFPGRRLAGPPAAPEERKPLKTQKESAKSHRNFNNDILFALSVRAQAFFTFWPSGLTSSSGKVPANLKSYFGRWV